MTNIIIFYLCVRPLTSELIFIMVLQAGFEPTRVLPIGFRISKPYIPDFHMFINFSVAVYTSPLYILTLLSVDEIFLPRYMNLSTNFRVLSFYEIYSHFPLMESI